MAATAEFGAAMVSRDTALEAYRTYYGSVDEGDIAGILSVVHDDVEMIHTQVWEHGDHTRDIGTHVVEGKAELEEFFRSQMAGIQEAGIEHEIRDLITDGDKGALQVAVNAPGETPVGVGWFEFEDGLISRYLVGPADLR